MNITKRNSMPIWLKVSLLVVGVILIAVGLFKVFGSNAFVDKFNKLQTPNVAIKDDLTSASGLLSGIGAKETKKDYAGINSDLQTTLSKLNDAETNVNSTSTALTELQDIVNSSTKQNIKTAGARFIDIYKSENTAVLKMVTDTKDLVNQATTYYNEVASNQKVTIDVNKFSTEANTITVDGQGIASISKQYDTAANDFAKAAGFTIKKK